MSYTVTLTPLFTECQRDFARDGRVLAELNEAVDELARRPFGNPRLETHEYKGRSGRRKRFISYVGNRGHRLIWEQVNQTIVLLLFGEHNPVEERAGRLDFRVDEATGGVRIVEYERATEPARLPPARAQAGQSSLFMAWTDAELAGFGFAPQEVRVLRRLNSEDELFALAEHMRPDALERAVNLLVHSGPRRQKRSARSARQRHVNRSRRLIGTRWPMCCAGRSRTGWCSCTLTRRS